MLPIDIPGYYSGKLPGALMAVKIDGHRIVCETSGEFSCDTELIRINAQQSGRFSRYRAGKIDWQITVNSFANLTSEFGDFKHVLTKIRSGQSFGIEFGTIDGVEPSYKITGQVFAKNLGISAVIGENVNSPITFVGSGPFDTDWNQFALIINAMPAEDDKPIYIETFNWD